MRAGGLRLALASLALAGLMPSLAAGCDGCRRDRTASTTTDVVPPPAALVAEITISRPDRTWSEVGRQAGAWSLLLPGDASEAVADAIGLPRRDLWARAKEGEPWRALWLKAADGTSDRFVAAVALDDGARLVRQLTEGSGATLRADAGARGLVWLRSSASARLRLAVLDDVLLIADHEDAVEVAGAYLARAPQSAGLQGVDVVVKGTARLGASVAPRIADAVERFRTSPWLAAAPAELLGGSTRLLELLRSASSAEVSVEVGKRLVVVGRARAPLPAKGLEVARDTALLQRCGASELGCVVPPGDAPVGLVRCGEVPQLDWSGRAPEAAASTPLVSPEALRRHPAKSWFAGALRLPSARACARGRVPEDGAIEPLVASVALEPADSEVAVTATLDVPSSALVALFAP